MDRNNVYIFNSDYRFRNDTDRIVMYSGSTVHKGSTKDWTGFVHPIQAMLLGLFTDGRTFVEHCEDIASHFKISQQQAEEIMSQYVMNAECVYTKYNGIEVEFPQNVLIPLQVGEELPEYTFNSDDLQCQIVDLIKDRTHKAPLSALFILNNHCLTKCVYCYADRKTHCKELPTERVLAIIDEAAKLKFTNIDIVGGEVFLRKDWDRILRHLVDCGLSPLYISTKMPVTRGIIERLLHTGYDNVVQISLDSMNVHTLSELIGCQDGYLDKLLAGVKLLQENGFKIQFDTILTNLNCSEEELTALYEYIKRVCNLEYWEIRVPEISLYSEETYKRAVFDVLELEKSCTFVRRLRDNANIRIVLSDEVLRSRHRSVAIGNGHFCHGNCGMLYNRMIILPDGKVTCCEQLYWHPDFIIGDLKTQTIEEVWQSDKAKQLFCLRYGAVGGGVCAGCKASGECTRSHRRCVVSTMKAYGLSNWDFPDPDCVCAPESDNLIYIK